MERDQFPPPESVMGLSAEDWSELPPETPSPITIEQLDRLVRENTELWEEYDRKKAAASVAFNFAEAKERELMAALKATGKTKYHVDGLGTTYIRHVYQVSMPKDLEKKRALFRYLQEKGIALQYLTINHQSLNSYFNEEFEAAKKAGATDFRIPGVDEPTHRETLGFRKGK